MGLSGSDGSDTAKHCWEDKSACKCVRVREFVRVGAAENDVVVGASVCFVCVRARVYVCVCVCVCVCLHEVVVLFHDVFFGSCPFSQHRGYVGRAIVENL